MDDIHIVEISDEYIESFHRCVDAVARERRYIGLVESPPLETTRAFVKGLLEGGGAQFVAVDATDTVVGWCDIVRPPFEGFRHSGRLGMGLLPHVRGRGLGEVLAQTAIEVARERGVERVELEVFAGNTRAIRLYERLGFVHEGVRVRARKLDGEYEDNVLMALVFEPMA